MRLSETPKGPVQGDEYYDWMAGFFILAQQSQQGSVRVSQAVGRFSFVLVQREDQEWRGGERDLLLSCSLFKAEANLIDP